jgi:hypothetical protein
VLENIVEVAIPWAHDESSHRLIIAPELTLVSMQHIGTIFPIAVRV